MSSPVEEEAVARGRGRPKGVKDSKPRAPRGSKKIPEATTRSEQVDISVYAAKQPEAAPKEEVLEAPAPEAPEALDAPEDVPEAPAPPPSPKRVRTRRDSPRPRRTRHEEPRSPRRARMRSPSPPLSYLEVMTRAMATARVAERDERSRRYDAFFQRR